MLITFEPVGVLKFYSFTTLFDINKWSKFGKKPKWWVSDLSFLSLFYIELHKEEWIASPCPLMWSDHCSPSFRLPPSINLPKNICLPTKSFLEKKVSQYFSGGETTWLTIPIIWRHCQEGPCFQTSVKLLAVVSFSIVFDDHCTDGRVKIAYCIGNLWKFSEKLQNIFQSRGKWWHI